jgi:hypothetical protein
MYLICSIAINMTVARFELTTMISISNNKIAIVEIGSTCHYGQFQGIPNFPFHFILLILNRIPLKKTNIESDGEYKNVSQFVFRRQRRLLVYSDV